MREGVQLARQLQDGVAGRPGVGGVAGTDRHDDEALADGDQHVRTCTSTRPRAHTRAGRVSKKLCSRLCPAAAAGGAGGEPRACLCVCPLMRNSLQYSCATQCWALHVPRRLRGGPHWQAVHATSNRSGAEEHKCEATQGCGIIDVDATNVCRFVLGLPLRFQPLKCAFLHTSIDRRPKEIVPEFPTVRK